MVGIRKTDSDSFASIVYQDEPLLITKARLESYSPPKYREMRKICGGIEYELESAAKIFYKQGKFMEDFEDDFDYQGKFARYFPTYQSMDISQLRGYFTWRAKVRHGIIEKTQLSFAFVYIYELLNQIGVSSPEAGFYKLKNFWTAYGKIDPQISINVRLWLKDYVVYNNLDKSLLEGFSDIGRNNDILTLLNCKAHDKDAVFSALNSMSSYNLENSRFFKLYPDDIKNVVYDVFSTLSDHYGKNRRKDLCEMFFGKTYASPYAMFKSAVFYHRAKRNDFVYEISDIYKYRCENGGWSCERFFRDKSKNHQIGMLLKNIDFFMRQKFNFKSTLKAKKSTEILNDIITRTINRYQEKSMKAALPKVEIDVSKLQSIRNAALEIQRKLTVEEFEEADAKQIFDEKPEGGNSAGLNDVEQRFMNCLLYGKAYGDLIQSQGLMLSVLVDTINERLFDLFGDTVIIDDGGELALIEDYKDELKGIIGK